MRKCIEDLSIPEGYTRRGIFDPVVHNALASRVMRGVWISHLSVESASALESKQEALIVCKCGCVFFQMLCSAQSN